MIIVATSTLREVARQGRLLTLRNRREISALRGLVISGQQTTGKTTALKKLGRTHELMVRPGRLLEETDASGAAVAAVNLGTAALKVTVGVAALATVRPWGRRVPRWVLLVANWGAAGLMLGHAAVNYAGVVLIAVGVISIDGPLWTRYRWLDVLLWEPVWLVGGILFALTAWQASRPRPDQADTAESQ